MTGSDVIRRLAEAIATATEELPAASAMVATDRKTVLADRLEGILRDGVDRLAVLADELGIDLKSHGG